MNRISSNALVSALCISVLALGATACKQKGPVEQAGEEIDEAIDTAKNGGKESTATKVDDAVDDMREGAKDAAKDLKEK